MNLTWEQRIDAVVELYHSQATQDDAFRVNQCEKVMHILNYVHAHKWNEEPSVNWDSLLQRMTAWSAAWNNQLIQKATTSPQPDQAFARFKQEQWTAQFIRYTDKFYTSLQNFVDRFKGLLAQQQSGRRTRGRVPYTDMQQDYLRLLQHVHDVPTLDDRQCMHYQKLDDPSNIQEMLQNDDSFTQMMRLAGVSVLWELDNMLDPVDADLPFLFNEMMVFYDAIIQKLTPVTPETQEMHVGPQTHGSPGSQLLQMTSLLHQLRHMCHRD